MHPLRLCLLKPLLQLLDGGILEAESLGNLQVGGAAVGRVVRQWGAREAGGWGVSGWRGLALHPASCLCTYPGKQARCGVGSRGSSNELSGAAAELCSSAWAAPPRSHHTEAGVNLRRAGGATGKQRRAHSIYYGFSLPVPTASTAAGTARVPRPTHLLCSI